MTSTRLRSSWIGSFSDRKALQRLADGGGAMHDLARLGHQHRVALVERQNLLDVTGVEGLLERGGHVVWSGGWHAARV
jgi:hypothetical protein